MYSTETMGPHLSTDTETGTNKKRQLFYVNCGKSQIVRLFQEAHYTTAVNHLSTRCCEKNRNNTSLSPDAFNKGLNK